MKLLNPFIAVIAMLLMNLTINAQQLITPMDFKVNGTSVIQGSYDYGYPTDWGPTTLSGTITGDLAWAYDVNGDSTICNAGNGNLAGKIAIVRRGSCNFSEKAYYAQQQGAIGVVILNSAPTGIANMLSGTFATLVTVPTVLLDYADAQAIVSQVDAGIVVNASFYVYSLNNPILPYAYATPKKHNIALNNISVDVFNSGASTANITTSVDITNPLGSITTLSLASSVTSLSTTTLTFPSYTPTILGEYKAVFKSTLNLNDSLVQFFQITPSLFALDDFNAIKEGISPANFTTFFRYDIGAAYRTGSQMDTVSAISFSLENANQMIGNTFDIILYDMTMGGTDYSSFTPVGYNTHTITAADTTYPHKVITKELFSLTGLVLTLNPNSQYLVTVQYDASFQANGNVNSPLYTHAGNNEYGDFSTMVYLDQLYTGGWANNSQAFLRLHTGSLSTVINATICDGTSYPFNNNQLTTTGIYYDTLASSFSGIDSIIILNLNVANSSTLLDITLCNGETTTSGGSIYNTSGTYTDTLLNYLGCDSIITLNLTVLPVIQGTSITASICQGGSYAYNGLVFTTAGTFPQTFINASGCDSIVTVNLSVIPNNGSITITETVCNGSSYQFGGNTFTTTGIYMDTLVNGNGCDTIITLDLTVNSAIQLSDTMINNDNGTGIGEITVTITGGSGSYTYLWSNGDATSTITSLSNGDYTVTITDADGCTADYTFTIDLDTYTSGILNENYTIQLAPNPVSKNNWANLNIQTKVSDELTIRIYTSNGQLMQTLSNQTIQNGENKIQLPAMENSGLYFITIMNKENQLIQRLPLLVE